jgi:hypothetical protein
MHLLKIFFSQFFRISIFHAIFFILMFLKVNFFEKFENSIYGSVINFLYFVIFWICVFSPKLFMFNYHKIFQRHSRWTFYLGCIFFYYSIFFLMSEISEFYQKNEAPPLKIYYAFLLFLVFFNMLDYMVPSYSRYRKLLDEGKWTGSER